VGKTLGLKMTECRKMVGHRVTASSLCDSEGAEHPKNPIAPEGAGLAESAPHKKQNGRGQAPPLPFKSGVSSAPVQSDGQKRARAGRALHIDSATGRGQAPPLPFKSGVSLALTSAFATGVGSWPFAVQQLAWQTLSWLPVRGPPAQQQTRRPRRGAASYPPRW